MRLKQFIIEQAQSKGEKIEGNFNIKELSDEDWVDWVERHCSDYLPHAGRHPIYRGFRKINKTLNLGVKDTNEFTRQSAMGVPNYYTLWMDNATQWRDYPRRSKSFIGTSNFRSARGYGEVYQLFPADNAKIGVCPEEDIWSSFNEIPGRHLGNFAHLVEITFKKIYGDAAAARALVDWAELKRLLELTPLNKFFEINKIDGSLYTRFIQKGDPRLIDYFEKEIVPQWYGFEHTTPANYSVTQADNKEVWVQGKVALLKVDSIFNLKNGRRLFPRTLALLSKHNIKKPN